MDGWIDGPMDMDSSLSIGTSRTRTGTASWSTSLGSRVGESTMCLLCALPQPAAAQMRWMPKASAAHGQGGHTLATLAAGVGTTTAALKGRDTARAWDDNGTKTRAAAHVSLPGASGPYVSPLSDVEGLLPLARGRAGWD